MEDGWDEVRNLERTIDRLEAKLNQKLTETDAADALIRLELDQLKQHAQRIENSLAERVHLARYLIVERIVFGLVGIVMTAFILGVVAILTGVGAPI